MHRSTLIRAAIGAAVMALAFGGASAQSPFPSKPIRLIVPYTPGGSTDATARGFAEELSKVVKQPVVVENRPGGGTAVGTIAAKAQPADGHTLLFVTDSFYVTKLTNPEVAYENTDFELIAPLTKTPFALIVPAKLQIKSLDDLKAVAAKKNGELDFGSLGFGASQYSVLSRALSDHLGVKPRMIPYKGGAETMLAIMEGQIDANFTTVSQTYGQKENAKIRILALTSDGNGPNQFFPEVKSFKELGVKGMEYSSLYAIAIRSDTPGSIKTYLSDAARRVTESAEMKNIRTKIAMEDPGSLDNLKSEMQKNFDMLRAAYLEEKKQ